MNGVEILVIGGAGFLGSRLCELLRQQGHHVRVLDKAARPATYSESEYIVGDVRRIDDLRRAMDRVDIVYNLAAEHRDDVTPRSLYYDVNVSGAENICKVAQEVLVRHIIFTSSVAVYGAQSGAMDEGAEHLYFNEYGRTKHLAEGVFNNWAELPENKLTIIRPTVVFGPGNRGNVYNFLHQMKYGPFLMIGTGQNIKSMAYIDNVVYFLMFCLNEKRKINVYNYADKPDFKVRDLVSFVNRELGRAGKTQVSVPKSLALLVGSIADIIAKASGRKLPISNVRVQKFSAPSEINAGKAFSAGFVAPHPLPAALSKMIKDHV